MGRDGCMQEKGRKHNIMLVFIVVSIAFVAAWLAYSGWSGLRRPEGESPPGPPRLPIVGNIFQLGVNPHKSLAELAKTYGPLMSLQLGAQFAVVVSSPEMAMEVLQKQGLVLAKPFNPVAVCVLGHEQISMNMLGANSDQWKKLRRIAREELFSTKALQGSQGFRRERLRKLVEHVRKCQGRAMNVGEATFTTMSNLMFATLFSVEYIQYGVASDDSGGVSVNKKFKEHVNAITRYMGVPNIADFFPIFAPLDPQGIRRKMTYHLGSLLEIVATMIEERLQARKASSSTYHKKNDFLEALLDLIEGNVYDLSIEEIKHMFLDLLVAGSDTSAATTEWAMVELLLHPDKLAKLKAELNSVVGEKGIVEESDISRLPYLQATIKEVLRYHPAAPLLAPHAAQEETQINGYRIPENTKIFVNFWAIARDPTIWNNPESFEPERFLGNDIDFKGQHFELIPFGSGRKMCPGLPLASRMLHCMVATLCHNFDWKLETGAESKQLQREDVFGLALQKKTSLWAIPFEV